jgi:hypothetical protein
MKKIILFLFTLTLLFSYELKEFVTCKSVKNLKPIKITSIFTTKDKKVYAFAYFTHIEENHLINFVWEKKVNDIWKLYANIELPIFKGKRWRTYSYITVRPYFKGEWRVSIYDGNDLIDTKKFKIIDKNSSK